jgi:hypothetical protein
MAHARGGGLIMAGAVVTFIGLCIVLIKVLGVPEYWVPLLVGIGLLVIGLVRRLTGDGS